MKIANTFTKDMSMFDSVKLKTGAFRAITGEYEEVGDLLIGMDRAYQWNGKDWRKVQMNNELANGVDERNDGV